MFQTIQFFSFPIWLLAPAATIEAVFEVSSGEEVTGLLSIHTVILDMETYSMQTKTLH